jgi:GT2 family glycosyltransferase
MNPQLSIVVATHNRGPVLVDCLRRTLANGLPRGAFEVLVVDNASTDGTAELVAEQLPEVTLIRLEENRGPVAKNFAIERARGAFLLLLDDDAFPHPGTTAQMLRHFQADPQMGAAVLDVTLPDGAREASAYPDVFIGAGTGLRRSALEAIGAWPRALPAHFFMQAEEYDLSFRLVNGGFTVRRFGDLPLTHLKTPGARIAARTTRLDVRNNLFLLARYLPEPLCHQLAADWLDRYFRMACRRDREAGNSKGQAHKKAFLQGAAAGLGRWAEQRDHHRYLLSPMAVESIFKFNVIRARLALAARTHRTRRIVLADYGKNLLAYWQAARELSLEVLAVVDDQLGGPAGGGDSYRGTPLVTWAGLREMRGGGGGRSPALVVVANMNPVQGPRRAAELRRTLGQGVVDLFEPPHAVPQNSRITATALNGS